MAGHGSFPSKVPIAGNQFPRHSRQFLLDIAYFVRIAVLERSLRWLRGQHPLGTGGIDFVTRGSGTSTRLQ